jgi:hypothetical protein
MLPVCVAILLAVYAAIQYGLSKRMTPAEFKAKHSNRDFVAHLSGRILTITVAAFIFGSIFFLRNVLTIWDCTLPEIAGGPTFVRAEPNIECNTDNDEYNSLDSMAMLGLTVYLAMFGAFSFGLIVKRDLFEFLGDKFEDAFFYWELVLLSRKVLIMASFLFEICERVFKPLLGRSERLKDCRLDSTSSTFGSTLWCRRSNRTRCVSCKPYRCGRSMSCVFVNTRSSTHFAQNRRSSTMLRSSSQQPRLRRRQHRHWR